MNPISIALLALNELKSAIEMAEAFTPVADTKTLAALKEIDSLVSDALGILGPLSSKAAAEFQDKARAIGNNDPACAPAV